MLVSFDYIQINLLLLSKETF